MGAWGHNAFANDDALDWLYDAEESGMVGAVKLAFRTILTTPPSVYLESPEGAVGLAAAEVVAISFGHPRDAEDPVRVAAISRSSAEIVGIPDIVPTAQRTIDRVVDENSELNELWNENGPNADWQNEIADLRARLN